MPTLTSITEENQLSFNPDKEINDRDYYNQIFNHFTSLEMLHEYEQAVRQLDKTSLSESDQWLLFDIFHMTTDRLYYDNQQRDKLCHFWLPIYESMFKQLLPEDTTEAYDDTDHERLIVIKYLVTNMIEMQKTSENTNHSSTQQRQFQNFPQKDEYLNIIQLIVPLLISPYIIERLNKDEQNNIPLQWQPNDSSNVLNVTTTRVIWVVLKLIMMFIQTDDDCLTIVKHDEKIKNILFNSWKQINDNNPVKLSLFVIVVLLANEQDIKNEIDDFTETVKTFLTSIEQFVKSEEKAIEITIDGVHVIDMMIAVKAYLQYDQVKNGFIENNGFDLLIEVASVDLFENSNDGYFQTNEDETYEMESDPEFCNTLQHNVRSDIVETRKEVQSLAFECLLEMSFDKKAVDILKNNEKFMSYIRKIATTTTGENLQKPLDYLLWKLEREDQFKSLQQTSEEHDDFDLMISYSWNDQSVVHDIYQYLTEEYHLRVWLDEKQTSDSRCQLIAETMHRSQSILICLSETYKASAYCRYEAEYARDRNKPIIPLVVKKVECDGWLGFLPARKIAIAFGQEDFQKALIAEIQQVKIQTIETDRRQSSTPVQKIHPTVESIPLTSKLSVNPNLTSNTYKQIPMRSWSNQHVQDFLYDNKLDIMVLLSEYMNGEELIILVDKCLRQQDCWTIFDRLNKEMEQRYQQILPVSVYLRFLNQTQKYLDVASF